MQEPPALGVEATLRHARSVRGVVPAVVAERDAVPPLLHRPPARAEKVGMEMLPAEAQDVRPRLGERRPALAIARDEDVAVPFVVHDPADVAGNEVVEREIAAVGDAPDPLAGVVEIPGSARGRPAALVDLDPRGGGGSGRGGGRERGVSRSAAAAGGDGERGSREKQDARRARHRGQYSVGVVSDTHGRMHPDVLEALAGVDRILHAGDVGDRAILAALAAVAPVVAVRGNVDSGALARVLPETEVVEIAGASIYMLHDLSALDLDPAAAGFAIVVSGHTHVPRIERKGGVLFLNPGSCGPRRFRLPVTLAHLTIGEAGTEAKLTTLVPGEVR